MLRQVIDLDSLGVCLAVHLAGVARSLCAARFPRGEAMSCPYLKEVVMLFCDAYPVKKMLPLDRIATAHPCLGQDFEKCPLFRELVARLAASTCDACHQPEGVQAEEGEGGHASCFDAHARHAAHARVARH